MRKNLSAWDALLYIPLNSHFTALNFEISAILILHFFGARHIICPLYLCKTLKG